MPFDRTHLVHELVSHGQKREVDAEKKTFLLLRHFHVSLIHKRIFAGVDCEIRPIACEGCQLLKIGLLMRTGDRVQKTWTNEGRECFPKTAILDNSY